MILLHQKIVVEHNFDRRYNFFIRYFLYIIFFFRKLEPFVHTQNQNEINYMKKKKKIERDQSS